MLIKKYNLMLFPKAFLLLIFLSGEPTSLFAQEKNVATEVTQIEKGEDDAVDTTLENEEELEDDGVEDDGEMDFLPEEMPSFKKGEAAKLFIIKQTLAIQVGEINRVCKLNDRQLRKLQIGAKGVSQKSLAYWVKENKQHIPWGTPNLDKKNNPDTKELVIKDADEIDEMTIQIISNWGPVDKKQDPLQHPFWKKILASTLNKEQQIFLKKYRLKEQEKRKKFRIDTFIGTVQFNLALQEKQIQPLRKLLQAEVNKSNYLTQGVYHQSFLCFYLATKIDNKKVEEILDPAQFQQWKLTISPYKSMKIMFEPHEEVKEQE